MTGVSVGSEQDVLLATELHVPAHGRASCRARASPTGSRKVWARKLVLVSAPAGSGKTALLADWARRNRRPVAWLSLDPGDNDPARFWRHAAGAGTANRDIAAELVVTLDTVKRHVSHILAKLDAANRTEAVARARDLNLIP
jgi:LuxR family transcriptional regulator, maltose regulon positive regulatory protein